MNKRTSVLLYDDHCPLCTWYSSLFVRHGFLSPEGRKPFSAVEEKVLIHIDFDKSRNEIPLVDTSTGIVLYGIDALLEILGHRFPVIKNAGRIRPVYWLLKRIYKFISLNRKVIVAKKCGAGKIDCSPDLNYFYRLLFMFVFLAFNTIMLLPLHSSVLLYVPGFELTSEELLAGHFALLGVNCILSLYFSRTSWIEYMGQVNMLALLGILLLLPLLLLQQLVTVPGWLIILYLALVAVVIFREYLRRMEYASVLPTHQWIAGINIACMTGFIVFLFS